jgi:methyl-accepting chemotaxis protein
MDEMTAGSQQISNAVQGVNQITIQTRDNIEALITEVSKFRV